MTVLNKINCTIIKVDYLEQTIFDIRIRKSLATDFSISVKAQMGNLYKDDVSEDTKIPGLEIKQIV